jgi:hypothetical protein
MTGHNYTKDMKTKKVMSLPDEVKMRLTKGTPLDYAFPIVH